MSTNVEEALCRPRQRFITYIRQGIMLSSFITDSSLGLIQLYVDQGDQIGQNFASWTIVYFVLTLTEVAHNFGYFFPRFQHCILILAKYGFRYNLGDFFTNSSGHPDVDLLLAILTIVRRQIRRFSSKAMLHIINFRKFRVTLPVFCRKIKIATLTPAMYIGDNYNITIDNRQQLYGYVYQRKIHVDFMYICS
jgi:hypothetical protein